MQVLLCRYSECICAELILIIPSFFMIPDPSFGIPASLHPIDSQVMQQTCRVTLRELDPKTTGRLPCVGKARCSFNSE